MSELQIDIEKNSADLSISKEIYVKILIKAIGQTQGDIASLGQALSEQNFDKVQSISHRLKGDYDNMRITSLSSIAKEMNHASKADADYTRMNELYKEFQDCFEQLQTFVAQIVQ